MTASLVEFELPRHSGAPRTARSLLTPYQELLGRRHGDVVLLVSELVANAVEHGVGEELRLLLAPESDRVRVEVIDGGSSFEVPAPQPDPTAPGGRGLMLVGALADAWGVYEGGSTHVWFELRL